MEGIPENVLPRPPAGSRAWVQGTLVHLFCSDASLKRSWLCCLLWVPLRWVPLCFKCTSTSLHLRAAAGLWSSPACPCRVRAVPAHSAVLYLSVLSSLMSFSSDLVFKCMLLLAKPFYPLMEENSSCTLGSYLC